MKKPFRFSPSVLGALVTVALIAGGVTASSPDLGALLAFVGVFLVVGTWFSVAIRTRQWFWPWFAIVPLTPMEGIVGFCGAVLFGTSLLVAGTICALR
jgi:hypothetical protein